ncbi:MAG: Gfo/Idh/MocA family oxidoreductase [Pseudomonadota bacterium]
MERKLKTGVVGAGVFGAFHAGKHAASPRAILSGIWDTDADRAGALADRHGARRHSTLDTLLQSVDAVTIATPAPSHFEIARQALEAGRHVYVEKPLAMNVEEADILIALAESQSLVLQVGHQERFVLAAMGAPRPGAAPRKLQFSRCGPPSGRGEDVSVVFDLMIHDLDIARLFGFATPVKVSACGDRHETVATLTFEGGRQCSFVASRRMEARRRVLKADYDDGSIEIDFVNRTFANSTSSAAAPEFADLSAFADPLGASVEAFFASALDGAVTMVDGRAGRGAIEWASLIEGARENLNASAPAFDRMPAFDRKIA